MSSRGIACLRRPPFLVVTSHVADNYPRAEALNLGACDVLAKPCYSEEVIRALGSAALDELAEDPRREPRLPTGSCRASILRLMISSRKT